MKQFLLASAALGLLATSAGAIAADGKETRIQLGSMQQVIVSEDGPLVEIRGGSGTRTLRINEDDGQTVIEMDGQVIELRDGAVWVDGEQVESTGRGTIVVIDGDEVDVLDGDFRAEFLGNFEWHMADRAEHLAEMAEHMGRWEFDAEVDVEGVHEEAMHALEQALQQVEVRGEFRGRDWDDLSEEEREEVREDLREAREEIREAMQEVRREMQEARGHMREAHRNMRVEILRGERDGERHARLVRREVERAERNSERAERHRERSERHRERAEHRARREMERHHYRDEEGAMRRESVRVIEDSDGGVRVWVDGEEQTGDDLTSWLNQLEADRLAGGDN